MPVYRGISVSPLHGGFAQGYEPKPSDLENLIAGRERELADFVDQSEFQSLLSGEVDVLGSTRRQKVGGSLVRSRKMASVRVSSFRAASSAACSGSDAILPPAPTVTGCIMKIE